MKWGYNVTYKEDKKEIIKYLIFIVLILMIFGYIIFNIYIKNDYSNSLKTYEEYVEKEDNYNNFEKDISSYPVESSINNSFNETFVTIKDKIISSYKSKVRKIIIKCLDFE